MPSLFWAVEWGPGAPLAPRRIVVLPALLGPTSQGGLPVSSCAVGVVGMALPKQTLLLLSLYGWGFLGPCWIATSARCRLAKTRAMRRVSYVREGRIERPW